MAMQRFSNSTIQPFNNAASHFGSAQPDKTNKYPLCSIRPFYLNNPKDVLFFDYNCSHLTIIVVRQKVV
ncbi:MAG: hypothetical protein IPH11_00940 [Ignavibacteriales bacterium]|nr:hypothetical protein [Ignavibacteriales bacterium]